MLFHHKKDWKPHHHHINYLLIIIIFLIAILIVMAKPAFIGYRLSQEFQEIDMTPSEILSTIDLITFLSFKKILCLC